jgi:hypothetical protein
MNIPVAAIRLGNLGTSPVAKYSFNTPLNSHPLAKSHGADNRVKAESGFSFLNN